MKRFGIMTAAVALFCLAGTSQAAVFTFQDDAGLDADADPTTFFVGFEDTYLEEANADTNNSGDNFLQTGDSGSTGRTAVLRADLDGWSFTNVTLIELEFAVSSSTIGLVGVNYNAHMLDNDPAENNVDWTEGDATWNTVDGAAQWIDGMSGARGAADFDSVGVSDTVSFPAGSTPATLTFTFNDPPSDLQTIIDAWTAGNNAGVSVFSEQTTTIMTLFSSEATGGERPILRITADVATPPSGDPIIPEPATASLLGLAGLALLRRRRRA